MLTRNLDKAREAFLKRDVNGAIKAHQSGQSPEMHRQGKYLKSIIYGGLDGTITTFSVVASVTGASLFIGIVLIMGFANLIGDGISMSVGDYLSSKAENEYHKSERKRELWEVENYLEGEKKEMAELYTAKGIEEDDANKMVEVLSRHKDAWVDVMMVEELGILEDDTSPVKDAAATFLSFVAFGFVSLLAYVISRFFPKLLNRDFLIASILTGLTLFALGAMKFKFTGRNWFKSGLEMLLVGGVAATAAYFIGLLLKGLA